MNPEYTKILLLIASGIQSPNKILKYMREKANKNTETLNQSNLSMKFQQLSKLDLIINIRQRSIRRSSTSKYYINLKGCLNYIINEFMPEINNFLEELETKQTFPQSNIVQSYLELYLIEQFRKFKSNETNLVSIRELLENFVLGVGYGVINRFVKPSDFLKISLTILKDKTAIFSPGKKPIMNKYEELFDQYSDKGFFDLNIIFKSFAKDYFNKKYLNRHILSAQTLFYRPKTRKEVFRN